MKRKLIEMREVEVEGGEDYAVLLQLLELLRDPSSFGEFSRQLELHPNLVNKQGPKNTALIHRAVLCENRKAVSLLLKSKADLEQATQNGMKPIHLACQTKNKEIIKILLEEGASATSLAKNGDEPVHLVVDSLDLVELLKSHGADTTARGYLGNTCLHIAAEMDNVDSIRYFLGEGIPSNVVNHLTETPLHLRGGNYPKGKSLEGAELLLDSGALLNARTEWGDTPVHYAALRGEPDIFKYLVEEGAVFTKESKTSAKDIFVKQGLPVKEAEDFDITFLCKIAKSTCIIKTTYILDKIMAARKLHQMNLYFASQEENGNKVKGSEVKELTLQESEFYKLGEELREDISGEDSAFQYFIRYTPDSLNYLYDHSLLKCIPCQIQGRVYFDNLLFWDEEGRETKIFRSLIVSGKERVFSHPLFELFLKLKWNRVRRMFWLYIVWSSLYFVFLLLYTLQRFSVLNDHFSESVMHGIMVFFQITQSLSSGIGLAGLLVTIVLTIYKKDKFTGCYRVLFDKFIYTCTSLCTPILLGLVLYVEHEDKVEREITAVILIIGCFSILSVLSKIPRIGIQKLMINRVLWNMGSFLLTYLPMFISFAVVYHILLPSVPVFKNLDTAVIKVFTMLMGEFDFTANFVTSEDSSPVAKAFFMLYLVLMSLVMMNLVLGLAVSDISELEKVSKVRSAVLEYYTLNLVEKALLQMRKMPGMSHCVVNPSLLVAENGTQNNIYLDLVDLDKNPRNRIYIENINQGVLEDFECPHDIVVNIIQILKEGIAEVTGQKQDDEQAAMAKEMKQIITEMKQSQDLLVTRLEDMKRELVGRRIEVRSALSD